MNIFASQLQNGTQLFRNKKNIQIETRMQFLLRQSVSNHPLLYAMRYWLLSLHSIRPSLVTWTECNMIFPLYMCQKGIFRIEGSQRTQKTAETLLF